MENMILCVFASLIGVAGVVVRARIAAPVVRLGSGVNLAAQGTGASSFGAHAVKRTFPRTAPIDVVLPAGRHLS